MIERMSSIDNVIVTLDKNQPLPKTQLQLVTWQRAAAFPMLSDKVRDNHLRGRFNVASSRHKLATNLQ